MRLLDMTSVLTAPHRNILVVRRRLVVHCNLGGVGASRAGTPTQNETEDGKDRGGHGRLPVEPLSARSSLAKGSCGDQSYGGRESAAKMVSFRAITRACRRLSSCRCRRPIKMYLLQMILPGRFHEVLGVTVQPMSDGSQPGPGHPGIRGSCRRSRVSGARQDHLSRLGGGAARHWHSA